MKQRLIAISLLLSVLFVISCSQDRPRSISFAKEGRQNKNREQGNKMSREAKVGDELFIELEDSSLPSELRSRRAVSVKLVQEAMPLMESDKKREIVIQNLEEAIDVDPTNPYAFFLLGKVFSKSRSYDEAAAAYSKAATYFKSKPNWLLESYLQLGMAYEKSSQKERGLESFKRALEIDPENRLAKKGVKRLQ